MRAVLLVMVVACSAPPAPPPVLANAPEPVSRSTELFHLSETSFGPVHGQTLASLNSLREAFRGYDVRPRNDDDLQFMVSKSGEDLFYVIIDDPTGLVFNIHVVSPRIKAPHRKWRAKMAFHGTATLTKCECWGSAPMCFKEGDFIAVGFARECDGLDTKAERKALEGVQVDRLVWSPKPFGVEDDDASDPCGGNPCGGNPCGGNPCGGNPCGGNPCNP